MDEQGQQQPGLGNTGLAAFVAGLPAAVWAKDADGRYLFANAGFRTLVGVAADTVVAGATDEAFFSAAIAATFRESDRAVLESNVAQQYYESLPLPRGLTHVLTIKFPLRDAAGQAYAVCGLCVDVSDTVLNREQLAEREAQLLALSRSPAIDTGELDASLPLVTAAAAAGLGVARVGLWLWDDSREWQQCRHLFDQRLGTAVPQGHERLYRKDYPVYFAALDTARVIAAEDAYTDPRTREFAAAYLAAHGIGAMLDVPVRLGGVTVGVLCCEHLGGPRRWTDAEINFATALADTADRALVAEHRLKADTALRELNAALATRVDIETREARRAMAEAEATRQQLQEITDNLPGAACQLVWQAPGQFRFVYMSAGIERMTGLPPAIFLDAPQDALAIIEPADLPGLIAGIDANVATPGQPFGYVFRVRHARTGGLHWLETHSRCRLAADGTAVFYGSFTDITERKQLEATLADSERLLKAAMAASANGIWEWNLETDAVHYSAQWFRLLGFAPDELPQELSTFTRLCHPDDQPEVFAKIARTIESVGEVPYVHEFRMQTREGQWRWVQGRATISGFYADGRARVITGTNTDVDERKRLEQSLSAASRAKSDFLANVSHEIRTPVNAVIGLTHLIARTPLDPRQQDYLAKLQAASETLRALVDDVLDLSKIEAGKVRLETAPFSLPATLDQWLSPLEPAAAAKGLALSRSVADGVPEWLVGDARRLGQVLLNLTSNAVKFTPEGSVAVAVATESREGSWVRLRFTVTDTGIGLGTGDVERLFEPFEQADASTSRQFGGTGLGLAICKQLAELMCGAIGADANADGGSRFWFTARFGIAGPGAHTAPLADTSTLAGLRVLVAEDNDINLEILTELLAGMGITVRGARNGAEALDVIHTGWPQLVLMDMQMPVMDGLAATVALRQLPQGRGLPVIALTANALHEDRARCLAAGMNDHLAKPIDVAALQALLLRWRPKG